MNNFNDIINKLYNDDILLNEIIDGHLIKLSENNKYEKISISKIFSLINKIIQNLQNDIIFVTPAKKEIAYLSSILTSLTFYKKNFQDKLNNFENWLTPGTNVMLCASGDETGKVYKFLGKKDDCFISIGSLLDKSIKIDHRIDTLLQLSPVKESLIKDSMIGKRGYIPKPTKSLIDDFLNIKSYDNPMLCKNSVVVLTNFYSSFENFLNSEILISRNDTSQVSNLADIVKSGQIDENGNINSHSVEPLMVYTKDLGSIYEFSSKTNDEKIIICDDIKKLNENFPIIQQIKNNNKNFKFLIFAEEHEYEYVQTFTEKNSTEIWKFSKNEIKIFFDQIKYDDFLLKDSFSGKLYLKNKNHLSKKDIYLETEDTIFNLIDSKIKSLIKKIYNYEETKKNIIKDLISKLRTRMYELRDHIFGFPSELKEQTSLEINLYFTKLNSMESYLDSEVFDDLIEIGNTFKSIKMDNTNIFDKRLDEFHENLKLREIDSKGSYAVLTYNPERKIYYKENIKNRWGIDANVINSIDNIRPFKSLIVPSELVQSKITKLLLNDNFENVYFIGSKSLKEEINAVKNNLFNRWLNLSMNNEKKCEILEIDKKYINSFFQPEQPKPRQLYDHEAFFKTNDFSKYTNNIANSENEEDVIKVPAFLTIFNGDCYALATESFSFKVFNSVFDPSAFDKKAKIIKKDFKSIKLGDIVLMRYKADSDALDHEAILRLNNDKEKYFKIKEDTKKIPEIINKCLKSAHDAFNSEHVKKKLPSTRKSLLNYCLKKVNYTKGVNNVLSLSDLDGGTICPRSPEDLKKIFKACEIICSEFDTDAYIYDEKETLKIFQNAKLYKSIRQSAGFNLSRKLDDALIKEARNIEFDGDPLRVDYVNGNIIFGSSSAGKPEGYIVQVNNYEEPRNLKESKASLTNRLLFL